MGRCWQHCWEGTGRERKATPKWTQEPCVNHLKGHARRKTSPAPVILHPLQLGRMGSAFGNGTVRCDWIVPVWERFLGLLALCHQGRERSASRGPLHPFPTSRGNLSTAGTISTPLHKSSTTGAGPTAMAATPGATPSPRDALPCPEKPKFLRCPSSCLSPHVLPELRESLGVHLAVPSSLRPFPPIFFFPPPSTTCDMNSRQLQLLLFR